MESVAEAGNGMDACSVQSLLEDVTSKIAEFEAQQLPKLKGELQGFINKKEALVKTYKDSYDKLLAEWQKQDKCIQYLRKSVQSASPNWETYFNSCVVAKIKELEDRRQALDARLDCGKGPKERARDSAKAAATKAKAELVALQDNEKGVSAALKQHQAWADDIAKLLKCPASPEAIYIFWGKLLPPHIRLAPEGATVDPGPIPSPPHSAPWLVAHDAYGDALEQAWCTYNNAKQAEGKAQGDFAKTPDDVATEAKAIDAAGKALDDDVRKCLADVKPDNGCGCAETKDDQKPGKGGSKPANGGAGNPVKDDARKVDGDQPSEEPKAETPG
ncbi:hypothetical protein [Mesorhizobium sp.]|uniref:hypothetical protein n=1 Tax=Mesorhizobium sp. TaxID=1871066 RepID=UPI000FE8230A|nr:hypothetical protein [Mesorhizobium sp.]RWO22195.1 MAG: hypothetical protein EOS09_21405 [Mesorhizobium sp.]